MKRIITILCLICLTGCGCFFTKEVKVINEASENSIISEDVSSYTLDLRIYGKYNNTYINKIVRATNYKNKEYKYSITDKEEKTEYIRKNEETYKLVKDKYIKSELKNYLNPDSYLEGLDNLQDAKFESTEVLTNKKYDIYSVTMSKKSVNKMLEDTDLNLTVNENIKGTVWTNPTGQIYKVYYYIGDLTIYASYFGYNGAKSILDLKEL